jgi:hypothetical protein
MRRILISLVCLFLLIGTARAIPPFPPSGTCSSAGCGLTTASWTTYFASTFLPMSGAYTAGHLLGMDATDTYIVDVGAPVTYTAPGSNIPLCKTAGGVGGCTNVTDVAQVPIVANVATYMGAYVQSVNETSEAATCNWANGSTCVIAGEANTTAWTLTMSNPVSGQVYRIYITQQSSGPVPLPTFSPTVTWVSSAPTFSGTNTKHDAITCQYVGTTYFCGSIGDNF